MPRLSILFSLWWILGCSLGLSADEPVRNVLLVVSDDLKASALGCYGNTVCKTPNIDKLARRGMVFENAYCQGMWCAPSSLSVCLLRPYRRLGSCTGFN